MSETAKGFLIIVLLLMVSAVLIWGFVLVIRAPADRQPVLETDSLRGGAVMEKIAEEVRVDGLYRVEYEGRIYLIYDGNSSAAIIEHRPVGMEKEK